MKMYVHYFANNDIINNELISILQSQNISINDMDIIYKYCLNYGIKMFIQNHLISDFNDIEIINNL
jgi:hypothetical protein